MNIHINIKPIDSKYKRVFQSVEKDIIVKFI